jgi:hypothetical protein
LLFSATPPALPMLAEPSVHGIVVNATEVAVRVGERVYFFDYEGTFRRELKTRQLPMSRARLLALTDDGRLWLSVADEGEDGKVKATTIATLDESGEVLFRHRLAGDRRLQVTPGGAVFVGRAAATTLTVERFDPATGRLTPHAAITIRKARRVLDLESASAVEWAVDDSGDVFVLTTAGEGGQVTRYRPSGERVKVWEVRPDPVTSVSYMKDVVLGHDGVAYATHSSWEVSASTGNDGSVLRLDPAGGETLRIKEGIGYLRDIAVAPNGDVFLTDLSEEVIRFSAAGERILSWVAVPPRAGDTWEGRRQLIADARRAGPESSASELVKALVYGDWKTARSAHDWLLKQGATAVPEVTAAVARYLDAYQLKSAADELWKAHPETAARLFTETRDETVKRTLAPHLGWTAAPPPGVREMLSQMVLEGDESESARHALNHMGATPEVLAARIAEFRKTVREGDASFDAKWDLTQGYARSILALEPLLMNPSDPDRRALRSLILEASLDATEDNGRPKAAPAVIVARTQGWATHADPFVRQTAAIALTAFGVAGHESEAIAAAGADPEFVIPTLKAFAKLAAAHPNSVEPHVPKLRALARSAASSEFSDALGEFAAIRHPAVLASCLQMLSDTTLAARRRAAVLSPLEPSEVARDVLLALVRDQAWQRALVNEYSYHSFVEDVVKAHPEDAEVRAALRSTLLALLTEASTARQSEKRREARDSLLDSLYPLVTDADAPRLTALLADASLERNARWQVMRLASRVTPDEALRERLTALLKDNDYRLLAAQSLGRIGEPAALGVLVEHGLKRLGFYSNVHLEIESFRPLGLDAEQALLGLLDYPNQGTRETARELLVQWPSTEGRRRIRADFDRAIEAGQPPQSYDMEALALAGESLVEPLVKLAIEHPDAVEGLAGSGDESPLAQQLRSALAQETDPNRKAVLKKLVAEICPCEVE